MVTITSHYVVDTLYRAYGEFYHVCFANDIGCFVVTVYHTQSSTYTHTYSHIHIMLIMPQGIANSRGIANDFQGPYSVGDRGRMVRY